MELSQLPNESEISMVGPTTKFPIRAKFHRHLPVLNFYQFSFFIYDKFVPVLLPAASAQKYEYTVK